MNKLLIKKIAFFALFVVFLIITPMLIFDAYGYGFDFKKREIVKVGGISIKSVIPDVNVFVNNEYINKTAAFSKDLLIQKLIPGEYIVRVEKTNYHPWEKTLKVDEQKVAKAENIYLFQENIPFETKKENINNFFLSEKKDSIIYLTNNQELILNDVTIVDSTTSQQYFSDIEDINFFPNLDKILISDKNKYYYLDIIKTSIPVNLKFLETAEYFYLKDNSIIYKLKNQVIEYSLITKKTTVLRKDVNAFVLNNDTIYSVEDKILVKISNNKETILSEIPLELNNYRLIIISNRIFAYDGSSLYLFNDYKKEFEFFLKAKELNYDVLPDKIIFNTGSELWLLLLKDFESPFFKKSGSLVFLSRYSSSIQDINWFNDDYFFYTINDNMFVSEIDNRDNINTFQISQLPVQKLWFNEKILYILSDNKVYSSSKFNP
jgi:hypothetical protein